MNGVIVGNVFITCVGDENGEGSLHISQSFADLDGLCRADLLQHWGGLIERLYEEALEDMREGC